MSDLVGTDERILFYFVPGKCLLLLGCQVEHKVIIFRPGKSQIPPKVFGTFGQDLWLPDHDKQVLFYHLNAARTYLHIALANFSSLNNYFVVMINFLLKHQKEKLLIRIYGGECIQAN